MQETSSISRFAAFKIARRMFSSVSSVSSVYTNMSWEDWTLHGSSDKREVGRVDYTYMDLYNNPIYTKEDMVLYNRICSWINGS